MTWSRSAVLEQWARIKIERDVRAPLVWGGIGRRHLVSADESVDTVVEMSFIVMEEAAGRAIQPPRSLSPDSVRPERPDPGACSGVTRTA